MASRMRAQCNDVPAMIHMARMVAERDNATQYLTPRYYGVDFADSQPRLGAYIRIEPNGEVWQHSVYATGGPDGPVAPKRIDAGAVPEN